MTTQPETAVGSVAEPSGEVIKPSLEDRFAAHAGVIEEDEESAEAPDEGEQESEPDYGPKAETDEAGDEEAEQAEDAPKPIAPPASWTAEEKAAFDGLPRELQETVTRREAEREKFVQSKSQEAARVKTQVEAQALAEVQKLAQTQAERLQTFLPQIPPKPNAYLQVEDPVAWAEQQDAHDWAVAQHLAVQQDIENANALAHHAGQEQAARNYQVNFAILSEQFPEYVDPVAGVEHRKALGTIATELGFTAEELADPDARDILALRHVAELKTKADKYDKLMAERMQGVRQAKQLPKVSKPGQPQPREAIAGRRLATDRNAMRSGDMDAAARVFGRHL